MKDETIIILIKIAVGAFAIGMFCKLMMKALNP